MVGMQKIDWIARLVGFTLQYPVVDIGDRPVERGVSRVDAVSVNVRVKSASDGPRSRERARGHPGRLPSPPDRQPGARGEDQGGASGFRRFLPNLEGGEDSSG